MDTTMLSDFAAFGGRPGPAEARGRGKEECTYLVDITASV